MKNIIIGISLFLPVTIFAQAPSLEPIILVPGIMGSWNVDVLFKGEINNNWSFPPSDHTWDNLISALEGSGYVMDENLFIAFYDWRQNNINSVTDYLIPTIDQAVENSPTGKVDIIAHSMGGLMVRRYIQSDDYRDDIDQLIMLGTPNYGSSDVYTLWEGGVVPDNWGNFTENVAESYLWYITTATAQTSDNYDTIHTFIPSIKELLPVYDFLVDSENENSLKTYDSLVEAKNPFLENLNFGSSGVGLQNLGGITVIAGKGEGTVGDISVVDRPSSENKLWADGVPEPFTPPRSNTEGDNRVLLSSAFISDVVFPEQPAQNLLDKLFAQFLPVAHAQFEEDEFLEQIEVDSKHGDLPTKAIPEVFTALGLTQPIGDFEPPVEPNNITTFWFASPVEVKVTDPQDRAITKDSNNIPGAIYTGEADPNGVKMIIIPNGVLGEYKVELLGIADGEYHMATASFTDTVDNIVTVEKDVEEGEKIEYTINIDQETSLIEVGDPIITKPESDSAIDLVEDLMATLNRYYQSGKITNKGVYQTLLSQLKIALGALEEAEITRPIGAKYSKLHDLKVAIAKKLAISKLKLFLSTVNTQKQKGKIDAAAASDLVAKSQQIIDKVQN